jgi:hypothetical protein
MRLINNFEGGTNGTQILAGNSGGGSGDAFDTTNTATGSSRVFDSAQSMYGVYSMRLNVSGTAGTTRVNWTTSLGGTFTRTYGRFYWRHATLTARNMMAIRAVSVNACRFALNASGNLLLINNAGTTVFTGAAVVAVNVWHRFEWSMGIGSAVTNTVRLYRGDSTTLVEELSASSNYGTAAIDEISHGQVTSTTNIPDGWWDAIEVNDYGYPGPVRRQAASLGVG